MYFTFVQQLLLVLFSLDWINFMAHAPLALRCRAKNGCYGVWQNKKFNIDMLCAGVGLESLAVIKLASSRRRKRNKNKLTWTKCTHNGKQTEYGRIINNKVNLICSLVFHKFFIPFIVTIYSFAWLIRFDLSWEKSMATQRNITTNSNSMNANQFNLS